MQKKSLLAASLLVCTVFTFGFLGLGTKKDSIATVGKTHITLSDLNDRIKTFPAQYQDALRQKENKVKLLDQMIDEQLLLNAAEKENIAKRDSFKKQMEDTRKQLLLTTIMQDKIDAHTNAADAEIKAYFEQNKSQFGDLEYRHAKHILVKTDAEAEKILSQLKKGTDFDQLAKTHSIDPSGKNGGDLGWFTRGQLIPEFERAAYSLKGKNSLSGVVKTQYGFHIIKLLETKQRPALSFDQVKEDIRNALRTQKKQKLTTDYLEKIKKDIKITRDISKIK